MQAHHSQSRREVSSLQQQQDPGALYDFNLDEELEMDLDEETMEAMFGQDLASDTDILGMWIPEVLDWPTWVCVTLCYDQRAAITIRLFHSPALLLPLSKITCTLKLTHFRHPHLFKHFPVKLDSQLMKLIFWNTRSLFSVLISNWLLINSHQRLRLHCMNAYCFSKTSTCPSCGV